MQIPNKQWCRTHPSADELQVFVTEMETFKIPTDVQEFFGRLVRRPADWRLAVNLKTFLGLVVINEVDNVLDGGLTAAERNALVTLDRAGLSVRSREIAHGLLSVYARWVALKAMSKHFREAKVFAEFSRLPDPKLLDGILGQENV